MSEGEIFFNLGGPPGPRSGRLQLHGPCGGKGDEVHEVALFFSLADFALPLLFFPHHHHHLSLTFFEKAYHNIMGA